MEKEIISADIIELIGEYGIVKTKEKTFLNGKPWAIKIWYDICLDHGDGDIVASYRTLKTARKWAKEN